MKKIVNRSHRLWPPLSQFMSMSVPVGLLSFLTIFTISFFLFKSVTAYAVSASELSGPQTSMESKALKVALIHFSVAYKQPDQNLEKLKDLHRKAADQGAKLILNTELALSGYSFSSREDVAPFTQPPTPTGQAVGEMAKLAKELGVYIGITFPERDPETQSFYNSAVVLSPKGDMICRYHKIWGEKRWARPGSPLQDNTFETPWGRMGVAICADSYFSLIPRTLALKGADLIWIPANWPPTGGIDPLTLWQVRARENGIYLAACNRTGKDKTMDCSKAVSAVIAPDGTVMEKIVSPTSDLLLVDIPLDRNGKIAHEQRKARMALRNVDLYRQIYLDPWTENLTGYYQLPEPGLLTIHCLIPENSDSDGNNVNIIKTIEKQVSRHQSAAPSLSSGASLWLLPQTAPGTIDTDQLMRLAAKHNVAFALSISSASSTSSVSKDETPHSSILVTEKEVRSFVEDVVERKGSDQFPYTILHFGPAALAMVPMDAFRHPELGIVLAKLGCDMVLLSEPTLSASDVLMGTIRTIDQLAIAACSPSSAFIAHMKNPLSNLKVMQRHQPGVCTFELNTAETRRKQFYDRADFDVILKIDSIENAHQ